MRKILISILLAGAAASPALAQDHGRWHHDQQQSDNGQAKEERKQAREERQQVREQARPERSNGGGNVERVQQQPVQQVQRGGFDRSRFERVNNPPQQVVNQVDQTPRQSFDRGDRRVRGDWNRQGGNLRQGDRAVPNVMRTRNPGVVNTRRQGAQEQLRERSRWTNGGWNRGWRNDRRYDWRSYRDHHRSTFRLGIYYDPFGYGYRPFNIGYRFSQAYFGQQYWIDSAMYGLPYPPPGTAWVRYWQDAVLVDVYTGEVVDVIHNFFW